MHNDLRASARFTRIAVGFFAAALLSGNCYASGGRSELTSQTLQQQMSPGINLGNTLEAVSTVALPASLSHETAWGNPPANQEIFNAYAAAGFKSVRIPVSWGEYADSNDTIRASWMARVKQVVDYARNAGLYVMINAHWDGGWANQTTYASRQPYKPRSPNSGPRLPRPLRITMITCCSPG